MATKDNLEILRWGRVRNFEKKHYLPLYDKHVSFPCFNKQKQEEKTLTKPKSCEGYPRKVIVKLSYKHFKPDNLSDYHKEKIVRNTADAIEYFFRFDENAGFDKDKNQISKDDTLKKFEDDAIFKMIISPEDPEILTEEYIRQIMKRLEYKCGRKLVWTAVFHTGSQHPHAHIMISRTKSEGCSWKSPLKIDSILIKEGIRNIAEELATRILGRKPVDEYRRPFYQTIEKIGLARIDHIIYGNVKKRTGLFVPATDTYYLLDEYRLKQLPKWQQYLVEERLRFLSENVNCGFRKIAGQWRCYNPTDWKTILLDREKLLPFTELQKKYGPITIDRQNQELLPVSYKGTVLEHIILDDNAQKLGLIIQEENGQLHYIESTMEYADSKNINGKSVEVKPRKAQSTRYRLPEVKIQPGVKR